MSRGNDTRCADILLLEQASRAYGHFLFVLKDHVRCASLHFSLRFSTDPTGSISVSSRFLVAVLSSCCFKVLLSEIFRASFSPSLAVLFPLVVLHCIVVVVVVVVFVIVVQYNTIQYNTI